MTEREREAETAVLDKGKGRYRGVRRVDLEVDAESSDAVAKMLFVRVFRDAQEFN